MIKHVLPEPTVWDVKRAAVNIVLVMEAPVIMSMVLVTLVVILDTRKTCVIKSVPEVDTVQSVSRDAVSNVQDKTIRATM